MKVYVCVCVYLHAYIQTGLCVAYVRAYTCMCVLGVYVCLRLVPFMCMCVCCILITFSFQNCVLSHVIRIVPQFPLYFALPFLFFFFPLNSPVSKKASSLPLFFRCHFVFLFYIFPLFLSQIFGKPLYRDLTQRSALGLASISQPAPSVFLKFCFVVSFSLFLFAIFFSILAVKQQKFFDFVIAMNVNRFTIMLIRHSNVP